MKIYRNFKVNLQLDYTKYEPGQPAPYTGRISEVNPTNSHVSRYEQFIEEGETLPEPKNEGNKWLFIDYTLHNPVFYNCLD